MLTNREFHLQTGNLAYKTGFSFTKRESWVTKGILGLLFTGLEYKSVKVVITEDVDEQISHNIFYTAITRTTDKLKIYLSKETQKKLATKFVESNVGLKQAQIFAQHAGLKLKNKLSS